MAEEAKEKKAAPKRATKSESKSSSVKMVRESDGKTADVHPDEVVNYENGGYQKAK